MELVTRRPWLLTLAILILSLRLQAGAAGAGSAIDAWLKAQTNVQSWSADFVQTRSLKSLTRPLTAKGHVWFAAPNRFRWELGNPPETIAVRAPSELEVIYPLLKRVERFPLDGPEAGKWRDALALLEAGFPRSREELDKQYNIVGESITGETCELKLQPKSSAARKMMPAIVITFNLQKLSLVATELQFADGSSMRNDFKDAVLNTPVDEKLFSPEFPADYKVVNPLTKR